MVLINDWNLAAGKLSDTHIFGHQFCPAPTQPFECHTAVVTVFVGTVWVNKNK